MTDEDMMQKAAEATKHIILGLEASDFVSNVGWKSAEELRLYAADIAYDIYSVFADCVGEYIQAKREYFNEAFKDAF